MQIFREMRESADPFPAVFLTLELTESVIDLDREPLSVFSCVRVFERAGAQAG